LCYQTSLLSTTFAMYMTRAAARVAMIECIYPSLLMNMHDISFFQGRAILTPKNVIVEEINECVMSLIPGEEITYLSCDSPLANPSMVNRPDDVHTP